MKKIFISGAAGFIASNLAAHFAKQGHEVYGIDNFSREGSRINAYWLINNHDIYVKNQSILDSLDSIEPPDVIIHLASQTGVMPSIEDPIHDFNVNVGGTLKILEFARKQKKIPQVIFASTNKVYGEVPTRPINETQPVSFCSPYGCSKGAADQYVMEYYRTFNVPSVVLRMSCIYGDRQLGTEKENGWVCHFARNIDKEITIYGSGEQVRDILYIDDYVDLIDRLVKQKTAGEVFNIGGGIQNIVSVNGIVKKLGNKKVKYAERRPADQDCYISDITKARIFLGWEPKIGVDEGLEKLKTWVKTL